MSIHNIPDRYLNTTVYIFRESSVIDTVGDFDIIQNLAYASIKANIQPQTSDIDYEIQGKIHRQTHVGYLNRVENGIIRQIQPTDIILDEETGESYIILGIQILQAANRQIIDSHHIKLILKTATGMFPGLTQFETVKAKAKIQ